jgi:hypothetical protein
MKQPSSVFSMVPVLLLTIVAAACSRREEPSFEKLRADYVAASNDPAVPELMKDSARYVLIDRGLDSANALLRADPSQRQRVRLLLGLLPDALDLDQAARVGSVSARAAEPAVLASAPAQPEPDVSAAADSCGASRSRRAKVKQWLAHGWTPSTVASIVCRKVEMGFDAEQVLAAWGNPSSATVSNIPGVGSVAQLGWRRRFVYLTNDRVTTIQSF